MSPGQVALAPITPASPAYVAPASIPPVVTGATSGGETSLFLTLNSGAPVPSSSYPNRPAAGLVNATGAPAAAVTTAGEGATAALSRIPWVLLLVGAGVIWYLSKGGRA